MRPDLLPPLQTLKVEHLNTTAAYRSVPHVLDSARPTLLLVNSFQTSSALYHPQFDSQKLTAKYNLLAIEPLGHGGTRCGSESGAFTYWDSAIMNLQVLKKLGVSSAVCLGTSQGGWIVTRMALLSPSAVSGLVILGSSMDAETPESRELGCWDGFAQIGPSLALYQQPNPQFEFPEMMVEAGFGVGFGEDYPFTPEIKAAWIAEFKSNYGGIDGQVRAQQATINLLSRDGLILRLPAVECPVLWIQGSKDVVYSLKEAQKDLNLFVAAKKKKFVVVEGGAHYLSVSRPREVEDEVLAFF